MDDSDQLIGLFVWCALGAGLVLAIYYAKYWVKGFFRGFRKLKTEAVIAQATRTSGVAKFLYRWWTAPARGQRKSRMANELMEAAESGDLIGVRRLASGGVDVDTRRAKGGKTALMRASQSGALDVVHFLLQKGASVDATGGQSGKTALMRASEEGHWEIVELLIRARANVNAASTVHGKTALMGAVERGKLATATLLISAGADVHVRDKRGRTAEDIGIENGRIELLEALRSRGAQFASHARESNRNGRGMEDEECYSILGCTKTDSPERIRAQYYALVKQFHPDAIRAKNMPEPFQKFASERYLRIQEAYQHIMKKK